jgi:hypothetical protein
VLANEGGKFTSTLTPERLRAIKPALRVAFSNNFQTCCVEPRPCAIVAPIDSSESTRARVETGKSWRNETPTFWGLFRMALKVETKQETSFEFTLRFT